MTETTVYQRTRAVFQLLAGVHNDRVRECYGSESLSGKEKNDENRQAILTNFTISPVNDPYSLIVIKILGYYLVFDKMLRSSVPYMYSTKASGIKPQLCLHFRPEKRKKWLDSNGKQRWSPDGYLHIPHWKKGLIEKPPAIPSFTVGNYSTKYQLTDGTYILVHTSTEQEGKEVIIKLAELTDPKFRPPGNIEDNLTQTTRGKGKEPLLMGLKMNCFQISYYKGGSPEPFYNVSI